MSPTLDREISEHCLSLLKSIDGISDTQPIAMRPVEAGVWNNSIVEIRTQEKIYYFKAYRKFAEIPNYSPPDISATQRASVAQLAQSAAEETFVRGYRLVPKILASDDTAFVMEAIPSTGHLLDYLREGHCPASVTEVLPFALAKFHSDTRTKNYATTPLGDVRFRDYKLDLQYYLPAQLVGGERGRVIKSLADDYRKQRACIVHGDLNSMNVLFTPEGNVQVIDFEQAHLGSPSYDLAFILSELHITSMQFSEHAEFRGVGKNFVTRYFEALQGFDEDTIAKEATLHLATQVLYRFNGPSHKVWTSHVNEPTKRVALKHAAELLTDNPPHIVEIFS